MDLSLLEIIGTTLVFASAGLVSTIITRWIALPLSLVLVVVGFVLSLAVQPLGWDTGIRASNFQSLIMFVLLPVLIFESAYSLDIRLLKKYLPNVITLATVGVLISSALIAVVLFYTIDHEGFPIVAALLTGVVISATDPVAVVAQLKQLAAPQDLNMLIEGESLFNDATAIVLFTLLVTLASGSDEFSFSTALIAFLQVFIGGIVVGVLFGLAGAFLLKLMTINLPNALLVTLLLAYGSLYVGEHLLHVSGIVAVMFAALVFKRYSQKPLSGLEIELHHVWEGLGFIANVFVFVLLGLVVSVDMFTDMYLAILLAIGAAFFARILAVYGSVYLNHFTLGRATPKSYPPIMIWGGLRGAVTIALVLSLPTSLPYWWTIQSIGFGVVVFSLMVQATTTPYLIRKLRIERK